MEFLVQLALVLGLALAGLALLAGIGKCIESAERRGSNAPAFYALASGLFTLVLALAAGIGVRFMAQPVSMAIIAAAFIGISAFAVVGLMLGIYGTGQCMFDRYHRFKRGKLAGPFGTLIGGLEVAGLAWLAWSTTRDGVPQSMVLYTVPVEKQATGEPGDRGPGHSQTLAGQAGGAASKKLPELSHSEAEAIVKQWAVGVERLFPKLADQTAYLLFDPDFNVRFRKPPPGWTRALSDKQLLELRSPDGTVEFNLAVEKAAAQSGIKPQAVAVWARNKMISERDGDTAVLSERPVIINGLSGVRIDFSYRIKTGEFAESCWYAAHNGWLYQMSVRGPAENHGAVRAAATELFQRFEVIDPTLKTSGRTKSSERNFKSDTFGFEVQIAGTPWLPVSDYEKRMPGAALTLSHTKNNMAFIVVPGITFDHKPHLDAVQAGLAAVAAGSPVPIDTSAVRRPINIAGLSGYEFERGTLGQGYSRTRVLQSEKFAYLMVGLSGPGVADAKKLFDDVFGRMTIDPRATTPAIDSLTFRQQGLQAKFVNGIGMYYHEARQNDVAADYFALAMRLAPDQAVFRSNAVESLIATGRYRDACKLLESNPVSLRSDVTRSRHAWLLGQLGRHREAIGEYAKAFRGDFRNDDTFVDYLRLMDAESETAVALEAADRYLRSGNSQPVILEKARLLSHIGKHSEAISLLEARHGNAGDVNLNYGLIEAYLAAGHSQSAMKVVDQLLEGGFDSAMTYYWKSMVECELKRYRDAKSSLEKALEKSPAETTYKQLLARVNLLLGEGDTQLVKQEILPVQLPARWRQSLVDPLPASETKDAGAWYRLRAVAIEFRPGKEHRETTYRSIQLMNDAGVERYSTFDIDFDPVSQQVYVNELSVYDEQGQRVTEGTVANYYVVDDTVGSVASQRKRLRIPVPGLRPGHRIELVTTIRDQVVPERFRFSPQLLSAPVPVRRAVLYLHGELDSVAWRGSAADKVQGERNEFYWEVERPPVMRSDSLAEDWSRYVPVVYLGDRAASWQDEARNYLKLVDDRLAVPPEVRKQAEDATRGLSSPEAKVAALARFVQRSLTYQAIEFGRRARVMNRSNQTLEHRYGDCKDHSLLLCHLCEAAGIPARLALIGTADDLVDELPSIDQFNHMVVYLPDFHSGRFIDATDKDNDLSLPVPYGLAGKRALVLDGARSRLVSVPDYPEGISRFESQRRVRCADDGEMVVHEQVAYHGYWAGWMRANLKSVDAATRKSTLNSLASSGGVMQVEELELENLERTDAPLRLSIDYRLDNLFHRDGDHLLGTLPMLWEKFFITSEFTNHRNTPFHLEWPVSFKTETFLELPAGQALAPAAQPATQGSGEFFRWRVAIANEAGGARISRECSRSAGHFPADRYQSFYQDSQAARQALTPKIVIRKTGT